ncbi:MAG: amino acid adenylation domain-containing protein [Clostridia bacterium]|nr:amino acid adenylation domain-containing protein [Clostridia bacterium]
MSINDILEKRKSKLSANKLALLERLTNKGTTGGPTAIQSRREREFAPLSFAQQRLLFLDQLVSNTPAYNVVMALRSSNKLEVEVLESSINEIIRRHEALRTTFQSVNGQPFQVIAPSLKLKLPVVDLTKYDESERETQYQRMAKEEAQYVFDLAQGPLVRATLFLIGSEKYIFLLNIHHIVTDSWSLGVFFKELIAIYSSFLSGKASPLPELPIQYADFSLWQREWLQGGVFKSQLAYWKDKLGAEKTVIELPADRVRPPLQTFKGASLKFTLSPMLTKSIRALCNEKDATLFMVLIAALKILMHRYTGETNISVGTPIANRNRSELENLIGFFANTLVLKTDLSDNPSFEEVLSRVREVANGAYMHQDMPFELLVDELQLERNMSQNPLFQVCFVLQNVPVDRDYMDILLEKVSNDTAKFDFWISITDREDMLYGDVEYNADIFNESTIVRFLESYEVLLEDIVSHPKRQISELAVLSPAERHKLLIEWNNTGVDYPQKNVCLHELIEAQVMRTPNAEAVIYENEKLTYEQLNQQANQLANYLVKMGVGPDSLIGICMERSPELVVGLLGILKSGGAYVPLDPAYPPERLAFMMEDANPPILLTQQRLLNSLPKHSSKVICVDSDWEIIGNESNQSKASRVAKDNLAYMIYTSGSTGKPKGAMNTHYGIVNRLLWMQQQYKLNETDRVLQKTPFSFDVSVWEFFWPLITGACMVVAIPEGHKDPNYLARTIKKEKITTMHFVPSMLQVFLEEKEIEGIDTLRRVICSGEALPYSTQERFFARINCELHNLYGPTEAAVDVTYWACRKDDELRIVPIGKPVANTQIYLLDKYLHPVPVGVAGELHIGGVQLARGYYNRPELTEEKFIPDPFSNEKGARLYKTGDLARYMPDGNIEFLGRIDFQVKIRGMRIELGEIEAVIEEHPMVQKAAVLAHEFKNMPEHKQLVAYVIPEMQDGKVEKSISSEVLPNVQVEEWENVFDKAYNTDDNQEEDFNISSWNSSYTGLPLPDEEMRIWVNSTIERIIALQPDKVLEIGCGTGLLLSRVAPSCEKYWGTDISSTALDFVAQKLVAKRQELSNVKLFRRNADDFSDFEVQDFDVIVLNSVAQYFPNVNYLLSVLKKAVSLVARNGKGAVFLGDIRNLPLLETFHTEVELEKAPDTLTIEQLKRRIQKRLRQEQELVIDPEFFWALKDELPDICHVEIQLKRGKHQNELTRYRYDVVLHIGKEVQFSKESSCMNWQKDKLNVARLREILKEYLPEVLQITQIPNIRLGTINRCLSLLGDINNCPETVGELKLTCNQSTGIDPETFWDLGQQLQYTVDIAWDNNMADGSYQAIFKRNTEGKRGTLTICSNLVKKYRPLDCYASNPILHRITRELIPELRSYLKEKLPNHMIPSSFTILNDMPVNSNGKLDRKALPEPIPEITDEEGFVAPTTQTEKILTEVWEEVLGLEQVGINNNFFELGGDSIHSIQAVARAKQRGIQITTQHIFRHQTISELAEAISQAQAEDTLETGSIENNLLSNSDYPDFAFAGLEQNEFKKIQSEIPDVEDIYPLTTMQENMIFRCLNIPEPGLYVVHHVFTIKGDNFNVTAFERAWQCVIEHFPVLRTSFVWKGMNEPRQIVHKNVLINIDREDWSDTPQTMLDNRLKAYIRGIRKRGFNLERPPHQYIALMKAAEDTYYFIYAFNLMLQDGWSYPIIIKAVFDCYKAFSEGREIELLPAYSYRNYIAWQRNQDMSKAEVFWKRNLEGISIPSLALLKPAHDHITDGGEEYSQESIMLPEEITSALITMAKRNFITPYTLLQGAWVLLLNKLSGKDDIVFGSIFSGRSNALTGIEDSIGLFFNILPIRIQVNPSMNLLPWLHELHAKTVETSDYEHTPLKKIHEWCDIPREQLLFESYLVSEQLPNMLSVLKEFSRMGGNIAGGLAQTEHPLRVEVIFTDRNLIVNINFYQKKFRSVEIACMLKYLSTLLEKFTANPDTRLDDLLQTALPLIESDTNNKIANSLKHIHADSTGTELVQKPNTVPGTLMATGQDIFNYLAGSFSSNHTMHIVFAFNGHLRQDILAKAVRATMDIVPVLGCRFVEHPKTAYWERRTDLDTLNLCPVCETERADEKLKEFIALSTDSQKDLVVMVKIFRTPDRDILCIKMDHACTDGGGLKEYAYILSEVYNDLCFNQTCKIIPDTIPRDCGGYLKLFGIDDPKKAWDPSKTVLPPQWPFPSINHQNRQPVFARYQMKEDKLLALKVYARNHKVSINDLLLTAYFRAIFKAAGVPGNEPGTIMVTVDLRRKIPEGNKIKVANYSASFPLLLSNIEGESFLGTLKRVARLTSESMQNNSEIHMVVVQELSAFMDFTEAKEKFETTRKQAILTNQSAPFLGNIGNIDFVNFGYLAAVEGYVIPPAIYAPGLLLCACTYNQVLNLIVNYYTSDIEDKVVNDFLKDMVSDLEQFIDSLINGQP